MNSPYQEQPYSEWSKVTDQLLDSYPLKMSELSEIVITSWEDIFETRVGKVGYQLGVQIFPQPQIMGFLLHELIPLNLETKYPRQWRRGLASTEFDAHCLFNNDFSFEIKTSSSGSGIFGNRSYAHLSDSAVKRRGGFMLTVNFEKFPDGLSPGIPSLPGLKLIRFGWLDANDWIGQTAQSGQQARLTKEAKAYKLKVIWEPSNSSKSTD